MKRLWVIPCRHDPEHPVVFDCIASIRKHQPGDAIMVVDSHSPDIDYLQHIDADHVRLQNPYYATGAWIHGLYQHQYDSFGLIHDGVVLEAPLSDWLPEDAPLGLLRWFPGSWGGEGMDTWGRAELGRMRVPEPDDPVGVFGPILWCDRGVLADLDRVGVLHCRPRNKVQASAMERIVGMVLTHLGHDFTMTPCAQAPSGSIFDNHDERWVRKTHLNRQ